MDAGKSELAEVYVRAEWAALKECVYGGSSEYVLPKFLGDSKARAYGDFEQFWIDNQERDVAEADPEYYAQWKSQIDGAVELLRGPGFRFGRIVSGAAWPEALAPLERLAPLPLLATGASPAAAPDDVVLWFEDSDGTRSPVCAQRPGEPPHWSVDPVAWIEGLLSEAYVSDWTRPLPSRLPLVNYSRVPHVVKGWLERVQSPRATASNPIDCPSLPLDELVEEIRRLCTALAFGSAPRLVHPWPEGRRAAVTLTHDVDSAWILDPKRRPLLERILEEETSRGFKGAWYITADQLRPAHADALRDIAAAGHEIGAHGWNHDSRLNYLGAARQEARMRKIHAAFDAIGVEGIRTPWYCRSPQLSCVLTRHFRYDCSVPNASSFFSSGSNSGCCTVFPYRLHGGLVELPMTLPPDTSLAPNRGYDLLQTLAGRIVERGGVVVVTLHPQPHQSANEPALARYFSFLRDLAERHAGQLWSATPAEIVRQYERALAA